LLSRNLEKETGRLAFKLGDVQAGIDKIG